MPKATALSDQLHAALPRQEGAQAAIGGGDRDQTDSATIAPSCVIAKSPDKPCMPT